MITFIATPLPIYKHTKGDNGVCRTAIAMVSAEDAKYVVETASKRLQKAFAVVDMQTKFHLTSVLNSMKEERVSTGTFLSVDGYGHSDFGRDALDAVYATLFKAESALVRIQFMSGTHAIAAVLYGVLRPGDEMLCANGDVYDTLEEVLGTRGTVTDIGTLRDFEVTTKVQPLLPNGRVDVNGVAKSIGARTKIVFIQRSFGYSWRAPLSLNDIRQIVEAVKAIRNDIICFVDNCYGEFIEAVEPVHESIGADVIAGSLIKNLGGGIVPAGAYVVGRADIVQKARARLAAPGVGGGATLGMLRSMFQGLFLAPGAVGEALKGSLLIAEVMSDLGYDVLPQPRRHSFVRAVRMGCPNKLLAFCNAVQRNGPVGAFVRPTVGSTEGYGDEVVFAQGTFIDGSTIELSADGPMREPYAVFAQGGLHWTHWAIVLEDVVQSVGRQS